MRLFDTSGVDGQFDLLLTFFDRKFQMNFTWSMQKSQSKSKCCEKLMEL